jgi:hypothetical protein
MELLPGHEKITTKSGISLDVGTLNRGFTVLQTGVKVVTLQTLLPVIFSE